jgi:hypothetical protein
MECDTQGRMTYSWATVKQFYKPFYNIKQERFLHILHFLHFTNNKKESDKNERNYQRLRKMQDVFEIINNTYMKYYNPSKHLAVDDITVLFRGHTVFKQYIKKHILT